MSVINITLNGSTGKMGMAFTNAVIKRKTQELEIKHKTGSNTKLADLITYCKESDILVDFSVPESIYNIINAAKITGIKLFIGTTGLSTEQLNDLKNVAKTNSVLFAPNASIGANLLAKIATTVAIANEESDVEIIDTHHRYKKDAPSGMSLMIGQSIASARNLDFEKNAIFQRTRNQTRQNNEIGFSSVRAGGIFGDCQVIFADDDEVISLEYRALSRDAFSKGAIIAAKWLYKMPPGFYTMQDVIGV